MKSPTSPRQKDDSVPSTRRISELEPPTKRTGNYVEILGNFKPLATDFAPSHATEDSKEPV